jgi:hypothetical protein
MPWPFKKKKKKVYKTPKPVPGDIDYEGPETPVKKTGKTTEYNPKRDKVTMKKAINITKHKKSRRKMIDEMLDGK